MSAIYTALSESTKAELIETCLLKYDKIDELRAALAEMTKARDEACDIADSAGCVWDDEQRVIELRKVGQ